MKAEVKKKWVEALRSGEYQQTDSALRDQNGYCCLGVLCEIARDQGVVGIRTEDMDGSVYYSITDPTDNESTVLPRAVRDWAGLEATNPTIVNWADHEDDIDDLNWSDPDAASLNDAGASFAWIADRIEEFL